MDIVTIFFVFTFGASIGSFLNVLIYRFSTGMTLGGRSMCASCARTLESYELVPILSFLVLRARCRTCKSKLSWQYPIVEAAVGIVALLTFASAQGKDFDSAWQYASWMAITFLIHTTLVAIFAYDLKHTIIPDTFSAVFAMLSLSLAVFGLPTISGDTLPHAILAGIALSAPFALIWLVSRGRWMGLGDAKLAVGMGFYLGLSSGVASLLLAFWLGAIVGVILMIVSRVSGKYGISMKSELPFAPFLIIGLWIAVLAHISLPEILAVFGTLGTI